MFETLVRTGAGSLSSQIPATKKLPQTYRILIFLLIHPWDLTTNLYHYQQVTSAHLVVLLSLLASGKKTHFSKGGEFFLNQECRSNAHRPLMSKYCQACQTAPLKSI